MGRPRKSENSRSLEERKKRAKQRRDRTRRELNRRKIVKGEAPEVMETSGDRDTLENGLAHLDPDGLTVKERFMVERFLIHGSKRRALLEAGYADEGSKVMDREGIQSVIKRELKERMTKYELTGLNTLKQLGYVMNQDPRAIFHSSGRPKMPSELTEAEAACLSGYDVEDIFEQQGEGKERRRVWVGHIKKFRFHSKTEAIALSMRHHKLLDGAGSSQKDRLHEVLSAMRAGPVERKQLAPPVIEGEVS